MVFGHPVPIPVDFDPGRSVTPWPWTTSPSLRKSLPLAGDFFGEPMSETQWKSMELPTAKRNLSFLGIMVDHFLPANIHGSKNDFTPTCICTICFELAHHAAIVADSNASSTWSKCVNPSEQVALSPP